MLQIKFPYKHLQMQTHIHITKYVYCGYIMLKFSLQYEQLKAKTDDDDDDENVQKKTQRKFYYSVHPFDLMAVKMIFPKSSTQCERPARNMGMGKKFNTKNAIKNKATGIMLKYSLMQVIKRFC